METFVWSIVFGIIGMGYYAMGKKRSILYAISGIGLMVFPYFVEELIPTIVTGVVLILVPIVGSRYFEE